MTHLTSMRMNQEVKEAVARLAKKENRTFSNMVETILKNHLEFLERVDNEIETITKPSKP